MRQRKKTFEEKKEIVERYRRAKEKFSELVKSHWVQANGLSKKTFDNYLKEVEEKENNND
jgi:transposase-like protein